MSRDKYVGKYMNKEIITDLTKHLKIVTKLEKSFPDLLKKDDINMDDIEEFQKLLQLFESEKETVENNKYVYLSSLVRSMNERNRSGLVVDITELRKFLTMLQEYCPRVHINYNFYKDLKIKLADNKHDLEEQREKAKWDRWSAGREIKDLKPHRHVIDFCDYRY